VIQQNLLLAVAGKGPALRKTMLFPNMRTEKKREERKKEREGNVQPTSYKTSYHWLFPPGTSLRP